MKSIQDDKSERSTTNTLDAATKLQAWKEVVGGKSRGRVYGIADLATNVLQGASSLSPPCFLPPHHIIILPENDRFHAKVQNLEEAAMKATQDAQRANKRASYLEHTLKMMQDQLAMMMEQQHASASTGTSQVHPNYAQNRDDQPLP